MTEPEKKIVLYNDTQKKCSSDTNPNGFCQLICVWCGEDYGYLLDEALSVQKSELIAKFELEKKYAAQCIETQGFHCFNKDCKNAFCPLNEKRIEAIKK